MQACVVCGTTDDKKPMTFRGEIHCSEFHRKVLGGEYGYNVALLVKRQVITKAQGNRLDRVKFQANDPAIKVLLEKVER